MPFNFLSLRLSAGSEDMISERERHAGVSINKAIVISAIEPAKIVWDWVNIEVSMVSLLYDSYILRCYFQA